MKRLIDRLFTLLGWFVCFERKLTDLLAWRLLSNGRIDSLGIEAERSTRNLIPNLSRDFSNGCHRVLVVTPDERLRVAVRRKLQRELPREMWTKVSVVTMHSLHRALEQYGNPGEIK